MPEPEFETGRLRVRRWRDADLPALQTVYGDADAMRWVGDGQAITHEECVQWLAVTRSNYDKRGYGMFAIERRSAPGVVGFCGIVHPGGQPEPEVKYALLRAHWGQGFATEAVTGLIAYGARVHGLAFIVATVAPQNLASHRVLLKAGMQRAALRANGDGTQTQLFHWRCGLPMPEAASDVDAYIASFPAAIRERLDAVRSAVRAAVPGGEERISYKMPAVFSSGVVVYYAAFRNHIGLYPPVADPAIGALVAGFAGPKGNLKFPHGEPLPLDLIAAVAEANLAANLARAAKSVTRTGPRAGRKGDA